MALSNYVQIMWCWCVAPADERHIGACHKAGDVCQTWSIQNFRVTSIPEKKNETGASDDVRMPVPHQAANGLGDTGEHAASSTCICIFWRWGRTRASKCRSTNVSLNFDNKSISKTVMNCKFIRPQTASSSSTDVQFWMDIWRNRVARCNVR